MNLKTAKALRKAAKTMAASNNIVLERALIEIESRRKYHFELIRDHEGNVIYDNDTNRPKYNAKFVAFGQMRNDAASVRGIYRLLKRQMVTQ